RVLVADGEAVEVADGIAGVEGVAVDEVAGGGLVTVGVPGDVGLGDLAFGEQGLGGGQVNFREVDFLGGLGIPLAGLGLGYLAPATHLGEKPDTVAIPGIGGVVFEE